MQTKLQSKNSNIKKTAKRLLPLAGVIITLLVQVVVPDNSSHPVAKRPYYTTFLLALSAIPLISFVLSFFFNKIAEYLEQKGPFWLGAALVIALINVITAKLALLPVIFFPSFDNILAIFVESWQLVLKCIFYSFKLLIFGVFWGVLAGFITGVLLGFSSKVYYWINPYIKLIGPIPATAWIPLVLTTFSTTFGASVFIIALAVWFPVQLMTSSGIQNTSKVYFEVGRTLGAGTFFQVFKIAVPAALPNIFQGVFNGICAAFIALMTAEMFGAKYGIGWYISWQKGLVKW